MKNSLDGLKSRLEKAKKKRISDLKIEIILSEQREKKDERKTNRKKNKIKRKMNRASEICGKL